MLSGRLCRVAQRTSLIPRGLIRQYCTPVAAKVNSAATKRGNEVPLHKPNLTDRITAKVFGKYNLENTEENLPFIRAIEMVREAENVITNKGDFERAEAMLTGALDYIGKHDIKDSWIIGIVHANLAYALQQNNKYDAAMSNYGIGLQHLALEPVRDPRFLGIRQLSFAELLSLLGEHGMAATTCQAAVHQFERVLVNDFLIGVAESNLAAYRMLEGKDSQAVPHAERALDIFEATLGKQNDVTRNCGVNLAKLYQTLGRVDDVASLDARFLEPDRLLLEPETGDFSNEYLESLRSKWRSQGPRKIFDPPGLHRSAQLSTNSYCAFLEAWANKKLPLSGAAARILRTEFASLNYSHDKLHKYSGRYLPKEFQDAPEKYKTGFEHLKIKGITSLAKELDAHTIRSQTPLTPADVTITPEEWMAAAERQRAYRAEHGDPQFEAAQEEFSRSEEFFEGAEEEEADTKKKSALAADEDIEEQEQDTSILAIEGKERTATQDEDEFEKLSKDAEAIVDRLEQQDSTPTMRAGWDSDTYNAYEATHGNQSVVEKQVALSEEWLKSKRGKIGAEEDSDFSDVSDEELHKVENLLRDGVFTQEAYSLLAKWTGRTQGLSSSDPAEQAELKNREFYKNPHYLTYANDYVTGQGIPTGFEVRGDDPEDYEDEEGDNNELPGESTDDDLELTEEEKEEMKKMEQEMNASSTFVDRPYPGDLEGAMETADVDTLDEIMALEREDLALKYKQRVRDQIARGEPDTPDTRYEREMMKLEKELDGPLRAKLIEAVQAEQAKRKEAKLVKNQGKTSPYDFNAEEDDVFDYGKEDSSNLKRSTAIRRAKKRGEEENNKAQYGRLHDTPWHDDFES